MNFVHRETDHYSILEVYDIYGGKGQRSSPLMPRHQGGGVEHWSQKELKKYRDQAAEF